MNHLTTLLGDSAALVIDDVRHSYGPDQMNDAECLAHAYNTVSLADVEADYAEASEDGEPDTEVTESYMLVLRYFEFWVRSGLEAVEVAIQLSELGKE